MKKNIKESNVQRMRNIVMGKHHDKTKTQSGWKKSKNEERVEGDVWNEGGKTWTIKNGIKQNITKMDKIRELTKTPLFCPVSGKLMRTTYDKFCYRRYGMSWDAWIEQETNKKVNGTWEEDIKERALKNKHAWLKDIREEFEEWVKEDPSRKFITENGQIEDWSGGINKDKTKKEFYEEAKKFEKDLKEE